MFQYITEEHRLIADTARRLFEDLSAADTERRQHDQSRLEPEAVGRALGELGLFGTDADDAPMRTAQVQALVAREAGAASLPYPVLETMAAHAVLTRCRPAPVAAAMTTLPSADREPAQWPALRNMRLNGDAALVPFAESADAILLAAQSEGAPVLVRLSARDAGIQRCVRTGVEQDYPAYDLRLDDVAASELIDTLDDGRPALTFLQQRCALLAAAEIAGASRRMVAMAQEHLLSRSQFGQVLGANQALKHALADSHVRVEALSTAIDYAAAAADADAEDAAASIAAAKHFAGRAGKAVADTVLQLHGAIGYTMEYPLHLLMRRVHRLGVCHGATRSQAARLFEMFQESA